MATPHPIAASEAGTGRIRRAAITLFRTRGYHGTPVRAVARAVRVEAGSLYYHFPSKQQILFDILDRTIDDLRDGLAAAVRGGDDPVDRLRAAVCFHVLFHAERRDEAFLSHSELRSLAPAHLRRIMAKRDRYEGVFRNLVTAGVRAGAFEVPDVKLAAMVILTACTGVASWFSERGRLDAATIADRYTDMLLRSVLPNASERKGHRA